MLNAAALTSIWILFLTNFDRGYAEDICYPKCECSFDLYNGMTSLPCIDVPLQTIEKYVENRPTRCNFCNFFKINNSTMPLIDSSTFSNFFIIDSDQPLSSNVQSIVLSNNSIQNISHLAFTNYGNLHMLDISYNNLTDIKNFIQHSTLEVLNIGFNTIEYLNSSNTFKSLGTLHTLYLNNNRLKHVNGAFASLSNLMSLYLNNNLLQSLSMETFIGLETLQFLNLSNNKLQVVPDNVFKNLKYLTVLDLSFNEILTLHPESFSGLRSLQNLLITNNKIKELPLGGLKNFPSLQRLQLGGNKLSAFETGSFSNLGNLKFLNLSNNNFSILDETVLFPLRNLELLNLDRNRFSYINYTSLLMHLPNLSFINVNDNAWECGLLTHMLKTFRERGVDYLFNASSRYTEKNVDGIFCSEGHVLHSSRTNSKENVDTLIPLIENISRILINLEVDINSSKQDGGLSQTYHAEKNGFYISGSAMHFGSNSESNIFTMLIFIFAVLLCTCILIGIAVYKQYFQEKNRKMGTRGEKAEIELLNGLT